MAVFQSPYIKQSSGNRWSEILDRISKGLAMIGKMHEESDVEREKQTHEDARDAARNSFAENLARFNAQQDAERTDKIIAGEGSREDKRLTVEGDIHKADAAARHEEHAADRASEDAYHGASLGLEARRIASEESRAGRAADDAARKEKHDETTGAQGRATTALHATETQLDTYSKEKRDVDKFLHDPASKVTDPAGFAEAKARSDELDKQISTTMKDIENLKGAAGFPGQASQGQAVDVSKLPADRQQLFQDLKAKNPGASDNDLINKVNAVPQATLDQAMLSRPSADTTATPSADFMPTSDKGAQQVAMAGDQSDVLTASEPVGADNIKVAPPQAGATAPGAGVDPNAVADTSMQMPTSPGGETVPGGEQQMPQTTDDQQSQDEQFQQFGDQLQQTPEGAGVHTTLDRLAQSDNSVQQEKLRRQAELQIGSIDNSIDPNSYIDWYIQQQTQEPGYA